MVVQNYHVVVSINEWLLEINYQQEIEGFLFFIFNGIIMEVLRESTDFFYVSLGLRGGGNPPLLDYFIII